MLFIDTYKSYPITNSDTVNCVLTLVIDFAVIFILTYIIDYVHGEHAVKKTTK